MFCHSVTLILKYLIKSGELNLLEFAGVAESLRVPSNSSAECSLATFALLISKESCNSFGKSNGVKAER